MQDFYSIAELTRLLDCSRQWVHILIKNSKIEPYVVGKNTLVLSKRQVKKLLKD